MPPWLPPHLNFALHCWNELYWLTRSSPPTKTICASWHAPLNYLITFDSSPVSVRDSSWVIYPLGLESSGWLELLQYCMPIRTCHFEHNFRSPKTKPKPAILRTTFVCDKTFINFILSHLLSVFAGFCDGQPQPPLLWKQLRLQGLVQDLCLQLFIKE